jgi:hypothetical protein
MQPKLKIVEPGWANYTGPLYGIDFVNGVSTTIYSQMQAQQVSAMIRIETEEGKNPSVAQQIVDSKHTPMDADMVRDFSNGELTTATALNEALKPVRVWTVEELNAIADTQGINGLRVLAEPLGVRGREIAAVIQGILEKQPKVQVKQVDPVPPARETVMKV